MTKETKNTVKASMEALSDLEKAYNAFVKSNGEAKKKSEADLIEAGRRVELLTTEFEGLKETKNTVAAETIVENLKEFANELHDYSKEEMLHFLLKGDIKKFKLANLLHDISHDLLDILDKKSVKDLFDDEEEDNKSVVDSITVNLKTGDAHGIEDITDPKLKEQLAEVIGKLAEKLGGK